MLFVFFSSSRIYIVHDEVKDKNFELELSWIGEGMWTVSVIVDISCCCNASGFSPRKCEVHHIM